MCIVVRLIAAGGAFRRPVTVVAVLQARVSEQSKQLS
jgi:hypothetical protein